MSQKPHFKLEFMGLAFFSRRWQLDLFLKGDGRDFGGVVFILFCRSFTIPSSGLLVGRRSQLRPPAKTRRRTRAPALILEPPDIRELV